MFIALLLTEDAQLPTPTSLSPRPQNLKDKKIEMDNLLSDLSTKPSLQLSKHIGQTSGNTLRAIYMVPWHKFSYLDGFIADFKTITIYVCV